MEPIDNAIEEFRETLKEFKRKASGLMLGIATIIIVQCLIIVWLVMKL